MRIKTSLLCAALLLVLPLTSIADEAGELKKQIMLNQLKLAVMENMEFTEQEAKNFWPVYEKYQEKLFQVNLRAADLIIAYSAVFQTLADDQALNIVDEYFDIRAERQKIMTDLAGELKEILPGKKVFRYIQVENKLEAAARYELSRGIPLAR